MLVKHITGKGIKIDGAKVRLYIAQWDKCRKPEQTIERQRLKYLRQGYVYPAKLLMKGFGYVVSLAMAVVAEAATASALTAAAIDVAADDDVCLRDMS